MTANPNVRGIRLTLPNPRNPSDPNNLAAIERWANSQIVNQIVAGTNVTIDSQIISSGTGANGTGVVTINASGGGSGYASLTGAGETVTPGALTQAGDFEVDGNLSMVGTGNTFAVFGGVQVNPVSPPVHPLDILLSNTFASTATIDIFSGGPIEINAGTTLALTSDSSMSINSTGGMTIQANSGGLSIEALTGGTLTLNGADIDVGVSNLNNISFYGGTGSTQPTITGSRGGNAALASLLTALATLGLIVDSSTP